MAEYINIRGQNIEVVASDPANPTIGQIWYNSTSNTLKGGGVSTAGSWATGNSLNQARMTVVGAGTQTAGLAFGGQDYPVYYANTEEYNGTSWTNSNNLNTAKASASGCGIQTAALSAAGQIDASPNLTAVTEEYDGTSWATVNPLNTARYGLAAAGIQTAAAAFGGFVTGRVTATENYNGTSWTNSGALNTARSGIAGAGTQTVGLAFGGQTAPGSPNFTSATEEYNGSTWTSVNPMNTAKQSMGSAGIQTAALGFGGQDITGSIAATEEYDGTSWSNSPGSLNTARTALAGCGHKQQDLLLVVDHLLQEQQKNGQVQVLHKQKQSQLLNTLLIYLINVERVKK
jgi:hypothetical protein